MAREPKRQKTAPSKDELTAAKAILQNSHLSPTSAGDSFIEFEFALHHITEAFARWSTALHESVSGETLPVQDVSMLQLIRMHETPKSAAEIGKFLNRDDFSNVLYALRKLEKGGLVEKIGGNLRQTMYQVTERGREVTDDYAEMRRRILLESVEKLAGTSEELASVTQALWRICGLYEQAARTTAMSHMLRSNARAKTGDEEATKLRRKNKDAEAA